MVIPFSTKFPMYHPRAGEPTHFVEKVLCSLGVDFTSESYFQRLLNLNVKNIAAGKINYPDLLAFVGGFEKTEWAKGHTIRAGNRFKAGEKFSPRVWSGRPYITPQIIFWNDVEVKKTFSFVKNNTMYVNQVEISSAEKFDLCMNDGLLYKDLLDWFNKDFNGQIICWNENINY